MIILNTNYDAANLATTTKQLSAGELTALQTAMGNIFTFPTGKTGANVAYLAVNIDVNNVATLTVITN
jgi:hypothetical protein